MIQQRIGVAAVAAACLLACNRPAPDAAGREARIRELGGDPDSVPELLASLTDAETARTAVDALRKLGPVACEPAMTAVEDATREQPIRRWALLVLPAACGPESIATLKRFAADRDPLLRESACEALSEFPTPEVKDFLAARLRAPEGAWDAVRGLWLMKAAAYPMFASALKDPAVSAETRTAIIEHLGETGEAAIPTLEEIACREDDAGLGPFDRLNAVQSLRSIGPPAAPTLLRIAREPRCEHGLVQHSAREALGFIGDPGSIDYIRSLVASDVPAEDVGHAIGRSQALPGSRLLEMMRSPATRERKIAIVAFGDLKSPDALDPLVALFRDPDRDIRYLAAGSVARYETLKSKAALRDGWVDPCVVAGSWEWFVEATNEPGWKPRLIGALRECGGVTMAQHLVNSGDPELIAAARRWDEENDDWALVAVSN